MEGPEGLVERILGGQIREFPAHFRDVRSQIETLGGNNQEHGYGYGEKPFLRSFSKGETREKGGTQDKFSPFPAFEDGVIQFSNVTADNNSLSPPPQTVHFDSCGNSARLHQETFHASEVLGNSEIRKQSGAQPEAKENCSDSAKLNHVRIVANGPGQGLLRGAGGFVRHGQRAEGYGISLAAAGDGPEYPTCISQRALLKVVFWSTSTRE